MAEQNNPIDEARAMFSEGAIRLLDAYYTRIRELYQSSSGESQRWVIGRLESLVNRLEEKNNTKSNPFDTKIARRIREEAGISQAELAIQTQTSLKSISRYEGSEFGPARFSHKPSEKAFAYLNWLKDKGYNPYNL